MQDSLHAEFSEKGDLPKYWFLAMVDNEAEGEANYARYVAMRRIMSNTSTPLGQ